RQGYRPRGQSTLFKDERNSSAPDGEQEGTLEQCTLQYFPVIPGREANPEGREVVSRLQVCPQTLDLAPCGYAERPHLRFATCGMTSESGNDGVTVERLDDAHPRHCKNQSRHDTSCRLGSYLTMTAIKKGVVPRLRQKLPLKPPKLVQMRNR
ncbi:hypothetical protein, partial [Litorimonas sp.]|uniref:hypothetical protein n=1 Tax=Litorimonas sp. TaxID=1892381 RepID=UPI003A89155D